MVKDVSTTGVFVVKDGIVNAKAEFVVNPNDFHINIPRMVKKKISEEVKVSVDIDFKHKH